MPKYLPFLFIILFFSQRSYTKELPQDSIVRVEELTFSSPFEQQLFSQYFTDKKSDYLALFMAVSRQMDNNKFMAGQKQYQNKLKDILSGDLSKKTEAKKIKSIYSHIHNSFLRKYELKNYFSEIFERGYYNCVSATALYAMLFTDMQIPYIIKETPTHVYLIAFPETQKILIETTDPTQGYYVFDDKFKTSFVNNLKNGKLISEEEYKSASVQTLFDKHYFSEDKITIKELLGLQYLNDGLYKLDDNQLEEAFAQFEKAYLFYPSERIGYLLLSTAAAIVNKGDYSTPKQVEYLAKLSRYQEYGITRENIVAEFSRLTTRHLLNNSNPGLCDQLYKHLVERMHDEETKNDISFFYYYERGRILYNQGKYTEGLSFIEKAYQLKPNHIDIQALFVTTIGQSLKTESDLNKLLATLTNYGATYNTLIENPIFCGYLLNTYLMLTGQNFELKKPVEGEKMRGKFEKLYANNTANTMVDKNLIGRMYSIAAMHYFRLGNEAKAKNILMKGLELAPNDYELSRRLQILK